MRTLLWITIATTIYTTPMTVDYTADGLTYLIDNQGYEWIYEQELGGEEVTVMLDNNGTIEVEDDKIVAVQETTEL